LKGPAYTDAGWAKEHCDVPIMMGTLHFAHPTAAWMIITTEKENKHPISHGSTRKFLSSGIYLFVFFRGFRGH
jgi:hypothetical protein